MYHELITVLWLKIAYKFQIPERYFTTYTETPWRALL